jgi:hypothetical protein
MKKNKIPEKCKNKWVLFGKKNEILFCSKDIVRVIEEGEKHGADKVSIQKGIELGTCFF